MPSFVNRPTPWFVYELEDALPEKDGSRHHPDQNGGPRCGVRRKEKPIDQLFHEFLLLPFGD
jgi:hypothetical protein